MRTHSQQFFEQLYVPFVSFIEVVIRDHEEAKDIASEVFNQNLDELDRFDSSGDLKVVIQFLKEKAWIEIFNYVSNKNQLQKALEAFLDSRDEFEDSVENTFIEKEMDELMEKAGLTERQRKVMELFFLKVENQEAADMMKANYNTYRVHKRNAIEKYKRALKAGGFLIIIILVIICACAH